MSRSHNSAIVVARLLGTEGFSDGTANAVEKYFRTRSGLTERQVKLIGQLDKDVSRIMSALPIGDRLVIGKFIGLHKKMSFDTGLKIGLQAFAERTAKDVRAIEADVDDELEWLNEVGVTQRKEGHDPNVDDAGSTPVADSTVKTS